MAHSNLDIDRPRDAVPAPRRLRWLPAAWLALGVPLAAQAAVQATLDRSVAAPGEPVTLSITSDENPGGAQPDLAPLRQDFEVLGTSTGSQTSIVNGQLSQQSRWDVQLQPRHAGHLAIPPLALGSEHTQGLVLDVAQPSPAQQAADAQHAFVEVETGATTTPYVQQQVPYTVRLFYDDTVTPTQLDAPAPADAVVDQLGPDKHYTAERHGHGYNVIERDYAIAPERSGTLSIPAPGFRGTQAVAADASGERDPQQDLLSRMFAGSPFRNMPGLPDLRAAFGADSPFGGGSRPIVGQGRAISLAVRPRPPGLHGDWLPAEQVSLADSWAAGAPAFKVGEPVTRVITLQAKGLAGSQIPALALATPAGANAYPETPVTESRTDGQAIFGSSRQSVTYIPTQAGAIDVPPVDVAWWDVQGNVERHATLPAFHLKVAPGAAGATPVVPAPAAPTAASGIGHRPPEAAPAASRGVPWRPVAWVIGALLALAGVALSMRRSPEPATSSDDPAGRPARAGRAETMRALNAACDAGCARDAAQALLDLARIEWPADPPRSLGALAERIEDGRAEVLELDRALYGAAPRPWVGTALRQSIRRGLRASRPAAGRVPEGLAPLYPTRASG